MKAALTDRSLRMGRFPLVAVVASFGLGILLGRFSGYPSSLITGLAALVTFLSISGFLLFKTARQRQRKSLSVALLFFFFLLGIWRVAIDHLPSRSNFFETILSEQNTATSLVKIDNIRPGANSLRLETSVQTIVTADSSFRTAGKLLVYLPYHAGTDRIKIGDHLLINASPKPIEPPKNPYAFDGQNYWNNKQIYHRIYLNKSELYKHLPSKKFSLRRSAEALRDHWQKSFQDHLSGNELAVASALILGKKDLLTEDLRNAYADTGAIHVLAVSGLHVGIVNLLFAFIFGLFKQTDRAWVYAKIILTLLGIWGFAFVTGLSPSVQRAALMFSFLSLGQLGNRRGHLFNVLAAAALCILAIAPQQLFQPGFQLSFAAVAGIGLFQSRLERLWSPDWKLTRICWSAVTVSLAATLGTLPFSLYYFHQFPLYFLITGSLVVATAFGIMLAGIGHGLLSLISTKLAGFSGYLLKFLVGLQNGIVFLGRQLPGAHQDTDWINTPQLFLLLGSILLLGIWLRSREWKILFAAGIAVLAFSLFGLRSSKVVNEQQRTVVYQIRNGHVVDVVHGKRAVRLMSDDIDPETLRFACENHQLARKYELDTILSLDQADIHFSNRYLKLHSPFLSTSTANWWLSTGYVSIKDSSKLSTIPAVDYALFPSAPDDDHIKKLSFLNAATITVYNAPFRAKSKMTEDIASTPIKSTAHILNQQGALVIENQ